jgi:serine/threonine-protein kinase RsbW
MSQAPPARPVLSRTFPSQLTNVDAICLEVRAFLAEHDEAESGFVLDLVSRECLNNAIIHGNRQDPAKAVTLGVRIGRRYFCLHVEDQGPGFAWQNQHPRAIPDDMAVRGRGLPILEMYARRVRFNGRGNRITVWLARTGTKEQ